ncbi:---NA--- : Uncharacterized protein OS=Nocardia seriolae N-2927 GN=NS07_contig00110-0026 PE=4 SV=1 [Gemmata obscuriglobus UQM 2246]|nr:---NA--- : Uncharacterized protein OS=Nocardia seriolae N-2927 GN=NS07_contig00110-0026 PE=4 SV=1 [Gemmata obscuriglobus UQM 2246]
MIFFFDAPADVDMKIEALAASAPEVRATAAKILFWDEPVAAETALVTAAADPVERVAVEALLTLQYYPSRHVIRSLHGRLDHPTEPIRHAARESWDEIRLGCLRYVCDDGRACLPGSGVGSHPSGISCHTRTKNWPRSPRNPSQRNSRAKLSHQFRPIWSDCSPTRTRPQKCWRKCSGERHGRCTRPTPGARCAR